MMMKEEETYQTTTTGTQHGNGKTWTHHCLSEIHPDTNPHIKNKHTTPRPQTKHDAKYILL